MEPNSQDDVLAAIDRELLSLREFIGDDILNALLTNPIATDFIPNQPLPPAPVPNQPPPPESTIQQPLPPVPSQPLPPEHTVQPLPPVPVPNQPLPPVPVPNQLLPASPVANQPLPANRFTLLTETELEASINSRIPKNTKRSTNWGISVWEDWCKARGIDKRIESLSAEDINNHTAHFVQEARKRNGEEYPAASLTNIVSAIQRYLRENGRPEVSFFDEKNIQFDKLRKSLDAKMKDLTRRGIGLHKKQAQPITQEMEATLWEKEIFSRNTGRGLLNIVFWYSSKMFGLRAADEHRWLEVEQFTIEADETGRFLRFSGRSSKNFQGGLHQRKVQAKDLRIYADESLGDRCAVSCFEYYLKLIPNKGPFYRRPIGDNPPRFSSQIVGVNTLKNIVKNFCTEAGFKGQFSNHSGKVSCATELFRNNIDEQLIMKQTGHRSVDAVRCYKRPTAEHEKHVSSILQPPPSKRFEPAANITQTKTSNISLHNSASPTIPFTISSGGNSVQNIYISLNK